MTKDVIKSRILKRNCPGSCGWALYAVTCFFIQERDRRGEERPTEEKAK